MSTGINNSIFPREIYIVKIAFEDIDGYKIRPVLILYSNNNIITIAPITHVAPEDPPKGYYDEAKEPIKKWRKYGLDKRSWVKCANTKTLDSSVFQNKKPIGIMDEDGFIRITERICWYL